MNLLIWAGLSLVLIVIGKRPLKIIATISLSVAVFLLAKDSITEFLKGPSASKLNALAEKRFDNVSSDKDLYSFVSDHPCDAIHSTPNLWRVVRKAILGNHKKSLESLERNFLNQIRNAADITAPDLVNCYAEIAAAVPKDFKVRNPAHTFSKLASTLNDIRHYRSVKDTTQSIRTQISNMKTFEDEFEAFKKDLIYLKGFIVGEHDRDFYEIRYNYGQTAFLITKKTQFTSKGLFGLYVRQQGTYDTKKTEKAGGFRVTVPIYVEQPDVVEKYTLIKKNKELLASVSAQLIQTENDLKVTEEELKKSLIGITRGGSEKEALGRSAASSN